MAEKLCILCRKELPLKEFTSKLHENFCDECMTCFGVVKRNMTLNEFLEQIHNVPHKCKACFFLEAIQEQDELEPEGYYCLYYRHSYHVSTYWLPMVGGRSFTYGASN